MDLLYWDTLTITYDRVYVSSPLTECLQRNEWTQNSSLNLCSHGLRFGTHKVLLSHSGGVGSGRPVLET